MNPKQRPTPGRHLESGLGSRTFSEGRVCPKCARQERIPDHSRTLQRTMTRSLPIARQGFLPTSTSRVPGLKILCSFLLFPLHRERQRPERRQALPHGSSNPSNDAGDSLERVGIKMPLPHAIPEHRGADTEELL